MILSSPKSSQNSSPHRVGHIDAFDEKRRLARVGPEGTDGLSHEDRIGLDRHPFVEYLRLVHQVVPADDVPIGFAPGQDGLPSVDELLERAGLLKPSDRSGRRNPFVVHVDSHHHSAGFADPLEVLAGPVSFWSPSSCSSQPGSLRQTRRIVLHSAFAVRVILLVARSSQMLVPPVWARGNSGMS